MTNYYATGRTNYFAVKDAEAFKAEIDALNSGLEVVSQERDGKKLVALLSENEFGFVWNAYNKEDSDDYEIDWSAIFNRHLEDDWVAIIMETGAEGLRYVSGIALAFNNKGETIAVDLANEINRRAKELGTQVAEASW